MVIMIVYWVGILIVIVALQRSLIFHFATPFLLLRIMSRKQFVLNKSLLLKVDHIVNFRFVFLKAA